MSRLLLIISFALVSSGAWAQEDSTIYYFTPDWSPDGQKIAFEAGIEGEFSIFTVDIDGKNLTQLTDKNYNDECPLWVKSRLF